MVDVVVSELSHIVEANERLDVVGSPSSVSQWQKQSFLIQSTLQKLIDD
jgi:hypothetical protein